MASLREPHATIPHSQLGISDALWQEDIALEEIAERIWSTYLDDVLLARLDDRDFKHYACTSVMDVASLDCVRCCQWLQ
jgi:hypothetical protein